MTYGISLWLPFQGTGTVAARNAPYYGSGPTPVDPYAFWSNAAPSLGCGIDIRVKELDYDKLRQLFSQWRELAPNYYGDFYPLTPWSRDDSAWIGWQFDRPESGQGIVQVFRRERSFYETAHLKLHGLNPAARYVFQPLEDRTQEQVYPGRDLLETGLPVRTTGPATVVNFVYHEFRSR
jgi:alpha-galactosidase